MFILWQRTINLWEKVANFCSWHINNKCGLLSVVTVEFIPQLKCRHIHATFQHREKQTSVSQTTTGNFHTRYNAWVEEKSKCQYNAVTTFASVSAAMYTNVDYRARLKPLQDCNEATHLVCKFKTEQKGVTHFMWRDKINALFCSAQFHFFKRREQVAGVNCAQAATISIAVEARTSQTLFTVHFLILNLIVWQLQ